MTQKFERELPKSLVINIGDSEALSLQRERQLNIVAQKFHPEKRDAIFTISESNWEFYGLDVILGGRPRSLKPQTVSSSPKEEITKNLTKEKSLVFILQQGGKRLAQVPTGKTTQQRPPDIPSRKRDGIFTISESKWECYNLHCILGCRPQSLKPQT